MSAANLSSSSGSVLSGLHSVAGMNAISEGLDRLVEKINETVRYNFVLRDCLIDCCSSFSKEKLIVWISPLAKKFQNLSADAKEHFAIPEVVDQLFESLKRSIQQGEATAIDREAYYENCAALIREKSISIAPSIEDYDWMSLKISPSEDFKNAMAILFNRPEVQALNAHTFEQKMKELFREMEETGTAPMICNHLTSIFGLNRDKEMMDIAYSLEKGNPFHLSLVDTLLNAPVDLKDRNLCFLEEGTIHTLKVEEIHSEKPSHAISIFTLIGKKQKAIITVNQFSKLLTRIVWETEKEENLGSFIQRLDGSEAMCCEVKSPSHEVSEEWKKWLPAREYIVESFSKNNGESSESGEISPSEESKSFFQSAREGASKFVEGTKALFSGQRNYVREFKFTPTSSGSKKVLRPIIISLFSDEQSGEMHFTIQRSGKIQEFPLRFEWFCRFFPVKAKETIDLELAAHQQNEIYITQTEPFTNELLVEKLKLRSATEKAIIDHLKTLDLNPILHSLIANWSQQGGLLLEGKEILTLLKEIFRSRELEDWVLTICQIDEIPLQSLEQSKLLLEYVFRANLEQMAPSLNLSEGSDLIKLLGTSLETSKDLKDKRGIAILGETGSGKSTTTCFLIGAKMEEYLNRFGKTCVKVAEPPKDSLSQLPEVGFSLGISKTTFAQGFRIINLKEEDIKIGRKVIPGPAVKFPLHINQDEFFVVDFPGFYDTRGTEYEVITSFSIDHGILSLQSLDAAIQVLPYDLLTSRRSVFFINALRELSARFGGAFRDPILAEKIFFLITKQDPGVGVVQLRERALELVHEDRNSSSPDPEKCALLTFFANQCQNGRVFPILPMARAQRIDILNKVLQTANQPQMAQQPQQVSSLKERYQLSLESPEMKLKFADVLNKSIGVWANTVLPEFLEHSRNRVQRMETRIDEIQKNQQQCSEEIDLKLQKIRELNQENHRTRQTIELLQKESLDQLPRGLLAEITSNEQGRFVRIEKDIKDLQDREIRLVSEEDKSKKNLQAEEKKEKALSDEICLKNQKITNLTTGSASQILHKDDYSHRSSVPLLENANIDWVAKSRRAIDRGTDRLSDHASGTVTKTYNMNERFSIINVANVHKDYQLLPPGQDQSNAVALNQLTKGQTSISLDRGNYRIDVVANKIEFDYIRHHNDGKQICYGYIAKFDGHAPYPNLTITHTIPKAQLNSSEVGRLKQDIMTLTGLQNSCQTEIGRLKGDVKNVEDRLIAARTEIRETQGLLAAQKAQAQQDRVSDILGKLQKQTQENEKEKDRLELEIKEIEKAIQKLKTDRVEFEKSLAELVFQRKRWALFVRTHASHLENAIKMAQFFVSLKPKPSGIIAIDAKESNIAKECQTFLDFYQHQKNHLEEELNDLGLTARERV